ncbi:MAG: putative manganese-dependent inorganic diphosphatase [Oscillospiraceae bacterium]|nr:putative manganese-dependent inorganic diphosphatase [Oscillospiraceae bacterium]
MKQNPTDKRKVMVIGHRNPDTDSICSAIAYANLKNLTTTGPVYVPCRAGEPNQEIAYVLNRFGLEPPRRCLDVSPQVQDIDVRMVDSVDGETTMRHAWEIMRDIDASTLSVTDKEGHLTGIISLTDVATANMDVEGTGVLAEANTSYDQIARTLNGTVLIGDGSVRMDKGKIVIGASSPESLESIVQEGDIVILANRYETQFCAIELGAACLVLCLDAPVSRTIAKLAADRGCTIISTPCNTYEVARLINQSAPLRHYMVRDNLLTFSLTTPIEEVQKVMGKVRHQYFPVLDAKGRYYGMISRRNLLNLRRKQLILVDHNEKTQAVDGFEQAEILEIIDHHRLGNLETSGPVYFRNQPVGCTATIVYQMYTEQGVEIAPNIAGILCSAILSDTLMFRSPTCTPMDEGAARALARIAGVEVEQLAAEMFEAGENVDGRTEVEVFQQDFKVFTNGDLHFGVGQGSYVSDKNRDKAKALLGPFLPEAMHSEHVQMMFYMFTSVLDESTDVLFYGKGAEELITSAFGVKAENGMVTLPGVISRKKQFIPALLNRLQQG